MQEFGGIRTWTAAELHYKHDIPIEELKGMDKEAGSELQKGGLHCFFGRECTRTNDQLRKPCTNRYQPKTQFTVHCSYACTEAMLEAMNGELSDSEAEDVDPAEDDEPTTGALVACSLNSCWRSLDLNLLTA